MQAKHIQHRGRYLAQINRRRTIVAAYLTPSGWRYRCEATNRFVALSSRRLWRPVLAEETTASETIRRHSCAVHRSWIINGQTVLPVVQLPADAHQVQPAPRQRPSQRPRQTAAAVVSYMARQAIAQAARLTRRR